MFLPSDSFILLPASLASNNGLHLRMSVVLTWLHYSPRKNPITHSPLRPSRSTAPCDTLFPVPAPPHPLLKPHPPPPTPLPHLSPHLHLPPVSGSTAANTNVLTAPTQLPYPLLQQEHRPALPPLSHRTGSLSWLRCGIRTGRKRTKRIHRFLARSLRDRLRLRGRNELIKGSLDRTGHR